MQEQSVNLTVNGETYNLNVASNETLTSVLRERLGLTGTKLGCDSGSCGSCSVLIDGKLHNSCLTLAALVDGSKITTIEGLATEDSLHTVQREFVESGAVQCGFCTPGMVLAVVFLLGKNPEPSEDEIKEAISGNMCRCTGYTKIIKAIKKAACSLNAES